jgi:MFS family permease
MDRYLIALYTHFLALAGAISTAAILHFNVSRARRAETVRDARIAVGLIKSGVPFLPLFAAALLLTGAYMVYLRWAWSSGWIVAGIVGLVWMPLVGVVTLKPRLQAVAAKLLDAKDGPLDSSVAAALNDRVLWGAVQNNHAMSLIVMLIMVVKPSLVASFALLLVAPLVGVLAGLSVGSVATRAGDTHLAT